ncbi:sigma 54-interacting transcriptional regulator [Clostridium estertheticum]|uniref:sigma 54-interacting transcriptional regulator n=1 Tax=Clostridium estertheticum TaxID=238834 RepID=UPI001C7CBB04|nr:sigma 54-interacting transcriptional regulator [Clostridium estertheticum]MBX4264508.1 sigma 54-interacting transcriptional regulator [Clostridium estertheticum]WLC90946.1 sigma 54-interacting transcriptional regulator [Clostridium estertheticum]
MKTYLRFEIISRDRIGMVLDILKKFYENNISIHSLEVFPNKVYVKVENLQEEEEKLNIIKNLLNINGVLKVHEIELLSYEKNERRLRAIIDAVQDGILAITSNGEVELFNNYCEKVFHVKKENIVGKNIKELFGFGFEGPIINLLKTGKDHDNIEVNTKIGKNSFHYITSGRSVKDDKGKTITAVASLKDINEAIEMSNAITSKEDFVFKDIIGNSSSILKTKNICTSVAKSNSTILLRGESGTGKELFAKAIHKLSLRTDKIFLAINCAALPDNLIESELFGYVKGSFTGATEKGKVGLFKAADSGTLFLDEIGELSLPLQAKLLRVLQEGTIRKIGNTVEEKIDVRIIAATNRNLEDMIKKDTFREDLYYRLNVIPIYIPSLRESIDDIPTLVNFFIKILNKQVGKNIKGTEMEFIEELVKFNWPGNIRELKNVVERAMNMCHGDFLKKENLIMGFEKTTNDETTSTNCKFNFKLKDVVADAEKKALIAAMQSHKSCRKAAKSLGVSHTTIINKLNKYGINFH